MTRNTAGKQRPYRLLASAVLLSGLLLSGPLTPTERSEAPAQRDQTTFEVTLAPSEILNAPQQPESPQVESPTTEGIDVPPTVGLVSDQTITGSSSSRLVVAAIPNVPEPSTFIAVGSAVIGLIALRRKRTSV